jgi:hypothetical protein
MSAAISAVLALIEQILPLLGTSQTALIDSIINALATWLPLITTEIAALFTPIKNIIAALSANPATTAAQLTTLQALDAQVDSAFEAAVAADPLNIPPATA